MERIFNEFVKTESKYNKVPLSMRRNQFVVCAGCDYRTYYMQIDLAKEEAWQKGGSPRYYLNGLLMQPIPNCKRREKCLVGGFVIRRAAKAASSSSLIKRLLKQETYRLL